MKYFKNKQNEIFAYDEMVDSQLPLIEYAIESKWTEITEVQLKEINSKKESDYFNSLSYADKRKMEYPSIGDQLDAIWKGGEHQEEMMKLVMEVKNKYPKV